MASVFLAWSTVFHSSIATVIGPTPPGTGVIHEATSLTPSKSTSPTSRLPDFFVSSEHRTKILYPKYTSKTVYFNNVWLNAFPFSHAKQGPCHIIKPQLHFAVPHCITTPSAPAGGPSDTINMTVLTPVLWTSVAAKITATSKLQNYKLQTISNFTISRY